MNIAFVTVADLPEGCGNTSRLRRLIEALTQIGHRVTVWNQHGLGISPRGSQRPCGEIGGADFSYVTGTVQRKSGFGVVGTKLRAVREIARRLRQARAEDQLDVLWFNQLSFYDTYPLTRLARRLGVFTVQSYEDERYELVNDIGLAPARRLFAMNSRLADRVCPRMADAVVVISHYLREKYEPLVEDSSRLYLVPTIINCAEWHCPPERHCPSENGAAPPTLLYGGGFGVQDEIENIVEACVLLRDRQVDFRVVLLGANSRSAARVRNVEELIGRRGLSSHVQMLGFLPADQVKEHISRANILLNIRREGIWSRSGLSTKLSEYLASGRLVITSSVGEVPRYLEDGKSALMVSPQTTAEEIARAMSTAISDPALRRRIGKAGQEVARRHFDMHVVGKTLQSMLQEVTHLEKEPV